MAVSNLPESRLKNSKNTDVNQRRQHVVREEAKRKAEKPKNAGANVLLARNRSLDYVARSIRARTTKRSNSLSAVGRSGVNYR